MNYPVRASRLAMLAACAFSLGAVARLGAQGYNAEREFLESEGTVEKAVSEIRPTAKGRLPTLDGFVGPTDQPLDRYKSGYYECTIKVISGSSGHTLVRVAAKITAWYADTNPARSGYRTLPSNGRLETDLLDRLADALEPEKKHGAASAPDDSPAPSAAATLTLPAASTSRSIPDYLSAGPAPAAAVPAAGVATRGTDSAPAVAATEARSANGPAETDAARLQAEQHTKELRSLAQNLEEILRSQSRPENLAAVRASGTPVYARPQNSSQVLFSADAHDEFQILEMQTGWVHVQISGVSRGWIRRAQLELPGGFAETPAKGGESAEPAVSFRVVRETMNRFPGQWPPLRGKLVKVFDVEPLAGMATPAKEKLSFAKSLLLAFHPDGASAAPSPAGIVVIFDSADGGQISATLADVQQLQEARITETAFWLRCSLDPPEAFVAATKP